MRRTRGRVSVFGVGRMGYATGCDWISVLGGGTARTEVGSRGQILSRGLAFETPLRVSGEAEAVLSCLVCPLTYCPGARRSRVSLRPYPSPAPHPLAFRRDHASFAVTLQNVLGEAVLDASGWPLTSSALLCPGVLFLPFFLQGRCI